VTVRHRGIVTPVPHGLIFRGPLVRVTFGPHPDDAKATADVGGTPKTMVHHLMVDTGAQSTVVENVIAEALGLIPIRYVRIMGVSGKPEDCPLYRMSITIGMEEDGSAGTVLPAQFVANVAGVGSPPKPLTHVGLLGRDFLSHVRLLYDGPKGEFEIIDYRHVSRPRRPLPKPPQLGGWKGIERARKSGRRHKKGRR
jgi:hypothetical protein